MHGYLGFFSLPRTFRVTRRRRRNSRPRVLVCTRVSRERQQNARRFVANTFPSGCAHRLRVARIIFIIILSLFPACKHDAGGARNIASLSRAINRRRRPISSIYNNLEGVPHPVYVRFVTSSPDSPGTTKRVGRARERASGRNASSHALAQKTGRRRRRRGAPRRTHYTIKIV